MYVSMTSYLPTNEIPNDESGGDDVLREKFINMALLTRGRTTKHVMQSRAKFTFAFFL